MWTGEIYYHEKQPTSEVLLLSPIGRIIYNNNYET
jgi:hypothetical protein